MSKSTFQKYQDIIESQSVQQVFINHTVKKGMHYSQNLPSLECNLDHAKSLLKQVVEGKHIMLGEYLKRTMPDVDLEDYTLHLIGQYKQRILMYLSNIANLTFSEN